MKTRILFGFLLFMVILSCEEEKNSPQKVYDFSSITMTDIDGTLLSGSDTNDWKLDVVFTDAEKSLFDSIDFSKKRMLKSLSGVGPVIEQIAFYPNPVRFSGTFGFSGDMDKINIVIVDSLFRKKYDFKNIYHTHLMIDFTPFDTGYYRAYYVIQDSQGYITGSGYGDIKVERTELE